MKAKQIFSLILAALIASTVSCGSETTSDETTVPDTQDETTTSDARSDREAISDGLPEKNYNGAKFTIATETYSENQVYIEESTGDVIDDAVYKRNVSVEERFGIEFEVVSDQYNEICKKVITAIQAGEDAFDLCMTHVVETGKYVTDSVFLNWYDVPYVDFTKPWWASSTTEDLSVNGVCPLAVGDFVLNSIGNSYCVFYNKRLAENYKLDDLYGIVNDGKWTIDKMQEITKDMYIDLNANGKVDGEDSFGLVTTPGSPINTYLWAFGGHVLQKDQSGNVELVYHNAKTGEMVSKLCSFFFDNDSILNSAEDANKGTSKVSYSLDRFIDGRAVFVNNSIGASIEHLRDMKDDYGILPYPKWDETQENYYTMVDGSHDVLAVPVTVSDPERSGIITEALCAESYKKVVPAYYETALKTKYTRDDESIAMIDMIVNSRVFDLGYVYDGWKGASFIFQNLISKNDPNFESYWASNESAITTYYDSVIGYFENYGK